MRAVVRSLLAAVAVLVAVLACAQPALAAPPTATGLPAISGDARVGQSLSSTTGTWSGTTPMTFVRTWLRCSAVGDACVAISGATSSSYVLTSDDEGSTIRVRVTASNVDGEATINSAATALVAPRMPPVAEDAPVVSGAFIDGQALSSTNGTWTGATPMTFSRRWQRCDPDSGACTDLAATSSSYTPVSADVGWRLAVVVTATNADGFATQRSALSPVIAPTAPVNTVLPSVGGTMREGQTLTNSNPGTWKGTTPMEYTRQWLRCDGSGSACQPIDGATGPSYVATAADVGGTLRIAVTATNAAGPTTATSSATVIIAPKAPPVATTPPSITGTATDGLELTGADGTWTGTSTISRARSWLRCSDGMLESCAPISGQTATKLRLTSADVDRYVRLQVTATNPDGTTVEVSAPTALVAPAPPLNTVAPAVTGTTREGQVLTASRGTWTGTPTIAYTHQWHRCSGDTCEAIAGETALTYRLGPLDVGRTVRHSVVATNAATSTAAWSAHTAEVTPGPPVGILPPVISGPAPRDGETWTGTLGSWAGTAPLQQRRQWLTCSSTGAACTPIAGAIEATLRLRPADVGRTVRLEVTTENPYGTVKALSAQSPVIAPAPPAVVTPPAVAGDLRDGVLLDAGGEWSGTPTITFSHAWERCAALSDVCEDIAGATGATYRLTGADVGSRVRVRVGAVNSAGGGAATSAISGVVQPDPPRSTAAPSITGTPVEQATLTIAPGTFTGTAPIDLTYQWQRCDSAGGACADIAGATGATRTLELADRGSTLRARVTATNAAGSATATTPVSSVVLPAPPSNTVPPAVSPDTGLKDGITVTSTGGGWTGSEPIALSWRWQRCSSGGDGCADIPGASDQAYELVTADVGARLRAIVTASGPGGIASQPSQVTGLVGTNPPVNVVAPAVVGTARDGEELRADAGSWTGLVPFTTSYRWFRCDTAGENCGVVAGATSSTYRLSPGDVGYTVLVEVTQANVGGSTATRSLVSGVVAAAPPRSLVAPRILGGAAVGKTLTADNGVWAGTPELRFAYEWLRCDAAGDGCVTLPDATGPTYQLGDADNDHSLRVRVTAENAVGAATAESGSTAEVQNEPPVNVTLPHIEAATVVAETTTLQAHPGGWAGAVPMDFTYQWRRCDAVLTGCTEILGATGSAYKLVKEDVGKRLFAIVRAENVVDSGSAQTAPTPVVLPEPPSNAAPPVITAPGGLRDGAKLTTGLGSWKGAAPLTYSTRWLRCDASGGACAEVADATGTSYVLGPADVGSRIRSRITARNPAAEVAAVSAPTDVIAAALPVSTTRPAVVVIDGKPRLGGRLRAATGGWNGTGPLDIDARWQRCIGTSTAACDDIPGATGGEYILGEADIGRRLRIVVTATNAAGLASADSATTETVPAVAPASVAPPVLAGVAREGSELRAEPGAWNGTAPIVFAWAWERCTTPGAPTCAKIAGATRQAYTLTSADVGKFVRISVLATNAGGKDTRASAATEEVAGLPPRLLEAPTASIGRGEPRAGTVVSSTPGRFTGTLPLKTAVRWQRCNARGTGCADITGAAKAAYTLRADDLVGTLLKGPMRVVVKVTNVAGSTEAVSNLIGAVAEDGDVGAAGEGTVGAAGTRRKAKRVARSRVAATVRRVQLSSKGQLLVTLVCPRNAKGSCGVTGSIAGGRVSRGISANGMKKGATLVKRMTLKPAQVAGLRGKRSLRFLLRVAAPATPTRSKVRRVTVAVPKKLGGKVTAKKKRVVRKKKRVVRKKKRSAAKKPAASRSGA